ncbi:MAG: enolase C-terminal domain-like protein, partial [Myxococcota bacterium]
GIGYTYSDASIASLIENTIAGHVRGKDAMSPPRAWVELLRQTRNLGTRGLVAHAISAVDVAMWDLKARLLDMPLAVLWGRVRDQVPIYGSGGFTSYDEQELRKQLRGWASQGIGRVKMKVGRDPRGDIARVAAARDAIGPETELFVDANGAYERKQALYFADAFHEHGVAWFEEPVSSDDLEGLRLLRDRGPAGMSITAGEYGYTLDYFRNMLNAGAVDVLQADGSRCLGYSGLLQVAALCSAWEVPLSLHCCPALHAPIALCLGPLQHLEYFHDHVRIESELFDRPPVLKDGALSVDQFAAGHGLKILNDVSKRYALEEDRT